ncbi:DNRLRE domain-containing protein [Nonomuraea sp. NPDC003727]
MPAITLRAVACGLAMIVLPLVPSAPSAAAAAEPPAPVTTPPHASPASSPASPAPAATTTGTAAGTAAGTAPDEASARLTARLTGRRVEIESARTETTTTYANPDGSMTVDSFAGPIRFRRDGAWAPVDIRLAADATGRIAARGHRRGLTLGVGGGDLITVGEGESRVSMRWKGALPTPRLHGESATYPEVLPGADLVVSATRTGAEQFLLLKRRPTTPLRYTLRLGAPGMTARRAGDGGVELVDRKGEVAVTIPAPVMWDARVHPVSGDHLNRAPVAMTLSGQDLVLTPDPAFLDDPATRYPVTVDPSLNLGQVFDTFVQEGYGTDQSGATELKIGDNGGGQVARSFITWKTPGIAGKKILSASLKLWNHHSWSCNARTWEVWSANRAATSSRWPGPTMVARYATSTETKGWGSGCADGWVSANVTSLVQMWADKAWTESGMGLRAADEADEYAWKRFNSGNASSGVPYISVTYNSYPDTPLSTWVSPYTDNAGTRWTNTLTPQLRNHVRDPDQGNVRGLFDVYDGATLVVDNLWGGYVASNGFSAAGVPAGKLVHGRSYTIRSWANDGALSSKAYQSATFAVDTVKPPAPRVTSADYPADGGWHGDAGKPGTFTLTPADADSAQLAYRLDGGAVTSVPTTGAAVSVKVTPPSTGAHTLSVYTVDKAGNASPTTAYTFNVGAGTAVAVLTSPEDGGRTTGRLALAVSGTGFTQATFQYRRAEADTWSDIPVAHVVGADGKPLTAWPVAAPGRLSGLVWDVGTQLGDAAVQVRAVVFGNAAASEPVTVVSDRSASTAARAQVGPGEVNLLTGAYRLRAAEGGPFGLTVARSYGSRGGGGPLAPFGKEWPLAIASLRETSPTSVEVITEEGRPVQFTRAGDVWRPELGAEDLTLTGSYTLTDSRGRTTVFARHGTLFLPAEHGYETVGDQVRPTSIAQAGRQLDLAYGTDGRAATLSFNGVVIARYAYDAAGRLAEVWDPRISPPLKTLYGYDAAGRLTSITPPGELPWTPRYDADGRLLSVTRATLRPGTADQVAGQATTTVVYGVPLDRAAGGPADVTAKEVTAWGQKKAPTTATALLPPDQPPGSWTRATVTYLDEAGRAVNTLAPGGRLGAAEYDRFGHLVRALTPGNRELSQRPDTDYRLGELGISGYTPAERAELLSTRVGYDQTGRRKLEELDPVHIVNLEAEISEDLPAGFAIGARTHAVFTYDEQRPADAAARDLPTTVRKGARIVGRESMPDADVRTTATGYDWTTALPVRTVLDPGGLAVTRTVDRPVPYTAGGTGVCGGRPEWAGLACKDGDKIVTYTAMGEVDTITEGGAVTVIGRDDAGRPVTIGSRELGYDPATGRVVERGQAGAKAVSAYDRLGRLISHTDADGAVTRTEYDDLGRPAKVSDSAPSTTVYAYDHAVEPRGLLTSVTDSVAGVFTARYDDDGRVVAGELPGGLRLAAVYDEIGQPFARVYTRDGVDGPVLIDQAGLSVHGQPVLQLRTDTMTDRTLGYDRAGRPTSVQEIAFPVCSLRRYAYDGQGNRTRMAVQSSEEECPQADDAAATITGYTYADGRLTGDGYGYDGLGRTTALPGGRTVDYADDGAPSKVTAGDQALAWARDPMGRVRSETAETGAVTVHHYGSDGESPRWLTEGGAMVRTVAGIGGELAALTSATGAVRVQLTTLHGDVGTELDLDSGAATVLGFDEFGVATRPRRYGWLGARFVSGVPGGLLLIGTRLYDPALGRFLQSPYVG